MYIYLANAYRPCIKRFTFGDTTGMDLLSKIAAHLIVVSLCSGRPPIVSVDTLPPPGSEMMSEVTFKGEMSMPSTLPFTLQEILSVAE